MPDTNDLSGGLDDAIAALFTPKPGQEPVDVPGPAPAIFPADAVEPASIPETAVDDARAALEARARTLGVVFRANISTATLQARVEEAERDQQPLPFPEVAPESMTTQEPMLAAVSPQTSLEMQAGRDYLARMAGR